MNIPLFDNDARAMVGTDFKKKGRYEDDVKSFNASLKYFKVKCLRLQRRSAPSESLEALDGSLDDSNDAKASKSVARQAIRRGLQLAGPNFFRFLDALQAMCVLYMSLSESLSLTMHRRSLDRSIQHV